MAEILPSFLVHDKETFEERLRAVEDHVETIHVDIFDGSMFDKSNWHNAKEVAALDPNVNIELHVMTKNPLPIIKQWNKHVEGVVRAIVHAEIDKSIPKVLKKIQNLGLERGLAINPETSIDTVESYLDITDLLLLMGVHPGPSGQEFLGKEILSKIKDARSLHSNLPISCDGGVTLETAPGMVKAGCTHLVSASCIFNSQNIPETIQTLKSV